MNINEQILVMQAYRDGKQVECKPVKDYGIGWVLSEPPNWNWHEYDYRVKPEVKKWKPTQGVFPPDIYEEMSYQGVGLEPTFDKEFLCCSDGDVDELTKLLKTVATLYQFKREFGEDGSWSIHKNFVDNVWTAVDGYENITGITMNQECAGKLCDYLNDGRIEP